MHISLCIFYLDIITYLKSSCTKKSLLIFEILTRERQQTSGNRAPLENAKKRKYLSIRPRFSRLTIVRSTSVVADSLTHLSQLVCKVMVIIESNSVCNPAVIIGVITRLAVFNHEYDYRLNWTTRGV